jgi:hypothetical protein
MRVWPALKVITRSSDVTEEQQGHQIKAGQLNPLPIYHGEQDRLYDKKQATSLTSEQN